MLTLTQLAAGVEKLASRLPGPIRRPVEHEWRPISTLFLHRRAPRLLVIGEPDAATELWARTLLRLPPGEGEAPRGIWLPSHARGALTWAIAENEAQARAVLAQDPPPDLFLYVAAREPSAFARLRGDVEAVFGEAPQAAILAAIGRALPPEARLEFARVSGEPGVQREIAAQLTRSCAAVSTAIGAQPIPLADFPILTSLQALLVAGIVTASGREWNLRLGRDFLAALGVNAGLGLLLREGARAAVKLVPGLGNAISGAVAGAGTYAVGRAASAFFLEGLPLAEARRRFWFFKKKRPPELRG
ncbi:MAG: hypothetical protein PHQ12_00150 [Chthoniobacteraceae bacterium]|nr:hypothetical protein [Chthoniobacteraceae bacterium]